MEFELPELDIVFGRICLTLVCEILEMDLDLGCVEGEVVYLIIWRDGIARERKKQSTT